MHKQNHEFLMKFVVLHILFYKFRIFKKKKNNILKIAKQKTKPHLIKYLLKYIKNKEIDING